MYQFESKEELANFIKQQVMFSSEVIEYLGVSRQTLNSLVHRGKLVPIKDDKNTKLFLRSDVEDRKQEADELKKKYRPYD